MLLAMRSDTFARGGDWHSVRKDAAVMTKNLIPGNPMKDSILELLTLRKGTTLTKEMFLNHVYGGMHEPKLKIIDVFICKLRKKLAQASES